MSLDLSGHVHGPSVQANQIGRISYLVRAPPLVGLDTKPDQVPPLTVR